MEVFVPTVPRGQVVIKVEGEEGGSGGEEEGEEEEGVAEKARAGRTWRTCGVGVCVYRTKINQNLKKHKAAIHSIDIVWHDCPELGVRVQGEAEEQR